MHWLKEGLWETQGSVRMAGPELVFRRPPRSSFALGLRAERAVVLASPTERATLTLGASEEEGTFHPQCRRDPDASGRARCLPSSETAALPLNYVFLLTMICES